MPLGSEAAATPDGDWDDGDPLWSPDGTRIAFTSNRVEDQDRWRYFGSDLYVLTLENGKAGELQCLTDSTRSCYSPSWSPDGRTIAFLTSPKLASGDHVELFTIDASGKGELRNLTSEFEGSCADSTNDDMSNDHILPPPAWSPDGKTFYVLVTHRGATRVFAITREGAGKQPPALTPGNVYVRDFSVDEARSTMALLLEEPAHLAEIYVCSTTVPGELRRVTGF